MKFIIDENGVLKKVKGIKRSDVKIIIPDGVKKISNSVFFGCRYLKEIVLPSSVEIIDDYGFQECTNLKSIKMEDTVKIIGRGAFLDCKNLERITLPKSLISIGAETFSNCRKLKEIEIPEYIDTLTYCLFYNCEKLKRITLPKNIKKVENFVFSYCSNIKEVVLGNKDNLIEESLNLVIDKLSNYYINIKTNELIVTSNILSEDDYQKIEYENYKKFINSSSKIAVFTSFYYDIEKLSKSYALIKILPNIIKSNLNEEKYRYLSKDILNYKEYDNLIKQLNKKGIFKDNSKNVSFYDLFAFAYSIGAFSDNSKNRQKACEFIKNAFEKKYFEFRNIHGSFESLIIKEYNEEISEFFFDKNNFVKLINFEKKESGYIAKIFNNFEGIKEYGRSNRGNQHYRKVTIGMCEEYFKKVNFKKVNGSNLDISQEIAKFTRSQESFDLASEVREEYLRLKRLKKIDDHILEEPLIEKEEILNSISETLKDLNEIANKRFTYEFLSKYDPKNFVLGKYCSCCAHLEGVGVSIMKASILHPDCQNLIIKDNEGKIVAKSTLYINRSQGYGVFNNIELNNNLNDNEKKFVYERYIKAIEKFVLLYNEKNKEHPLTQINVGMHLNDLDKEIRSSKTKSKIILKGIDFSSFGRYEGDWQKEQYILFKNKGK